MLPSCLDKSKTPPNFAYLPTSLQVRIPVITAFNIPFRNITTILTQNTPKILVPIAPAAPWSRRVERPTAPANDVRAPQPLKRPHSSNVHIAPAVAYVPHSPRGVRARGPGGVELRRTFGGPGRGVHARSCRTASNVRWTWSREYIPVDPSTLNDPVALSMPYVPPSRSNVPIA